MFPHSPTAWYAFCQVPNPTFPNAPWGSTKIHNYENVLVLVIRDNH